MEGLITFIDKDEQVIINEWAANTLADYKTIIKEKLNTNPFKDNVYTSYVTLGFRNNLYKGVCHGRFHNNTNNYGIGGYLSTTEQYR